MPNQFQPFNLNTDITSTKTLLHEAIPLTGTIYKYATGSYIEENIKNFSHGQFQSVYDYPYLSSSANHIYDLTIGYASISNVSGSTNATQEAKKINMYNEMAQVLQGFSGSSVRYFESDLSLDQSVSGTMDTVFFVTFSRLLTKDQIKKNSFSIELGIDTWTKPFNTTRTLQDALARTDGSNTNNTNRW